MTLGKVLIPVGLLVALALALLASTMIQAIVPAVESISQQQETAKLESQSAISAENAALKVGKYYVPALGADWELTGLSGNMALMAANGASGSMVSLDSSGFGLPKPPNNLCKAIESLTQKPCKWEAKKSEDSQVVELHFTSGDNELIEVQSMRVRLADYPELGTAEYNGSQYGWLSHVRVADWLGRQGLGRLGIQAHDIVVKFVSASVFGEKAVHIFVDGSSQGWGKTLLEGVTKSQVGEKIWLYLVR